MTRTARKRRLWLVILITVCGVFIGPWRAPTPAHAQRRVKLWDRVMAKRFEKARRLAYLAALAGRSGRIIEQIRYIKRALAISASSARLWVALADAYRKRKLWGQCKRAAWQARRIAPKYQASRVAFIAGVCLTLAGRVVEGLAEYRRARFRTRHRRHTLYSNMGDSFMFLGRLDEALASYRRALRLQPTHALTYYALATAYDRQSRPRTADRYAKLGLRFDADGKALTVGGPRSVVFVPAHDRHYFSALVATARGRSFDAVNHWLLFRQKAGRDHPWRVSIAFRLKELREAAFRPRHIQLLNKATEPAALRKAVAAALEPRRSGLTACLAGKVSGSVKPSAGRVRVELAGPTVRKAYISAKAGTLNSGADACILPILRRIQWGRVLAKRPKVIFSVDVVIP